MKINNRIIGSSHKPFIIAEISANHNGSIERALQMIAAAKDCGADAVKLQTYSAETMTIDCSLPDFIIKGGLWDGFKLYDLYKWAATPFEWHEPLFEYGKTIGITVFSTPFDESAVDLLEDLNTPAYKIASFEVLDLPLVSYVASTGKPMIISTGMASEVEIEEAVDCARSAGCRELALLHCISSYPAPIEQSNLLQIPRLAERFGVVSGLSDHTIGTTAAVAATALGACLIEKHFILSRADKGPDSEFSIEPSELQRLCRETGDAWAALGAAGFERQLAEKGNVVLRRSIYFVKDLPPGHVITQEDIRRIRPGKGLAPKYFHEIVGKALAQSVTKGTPAAWNLLKTSSL